MRLVILRHLWGLVGEGAPHASLDDALSAVHATAIYSGVELPWLALGDAGAFAERLSEYGLSFVPTVVTYGSTPAEHLAAFRMQLEAIGKMPHRFVVSQSGRDAFDDHESAAFYSEALRIERDLGEVVGHETHRGRILYNPWTTRRLVERFPDLKLTCDYSHWVVVAERMLDEHAEILSICASRAVHVHARVGHENGPQVSDPRAPEYRPQLEAHERWWDMIWGAHERKNLAETTLTPEFGPAPYQPADPFTQRPLSDVRAVSDWMARRERERFDARFGQRAARG